MQGLIISNPKLEFLRPALERWPECIDRYNQLLGDGQAPYWFNERANLGLLSAAAWAAEMVTLEHFQTKKQFEEGDRGGHCDLQISTAQESVYIQATQRWPKVNNLNPMPALLDVTSDAKRISQPHHLKLGCLFVSPFKPQQSPSPEDLQDMVDDLQKAHSCAVAWYFPYAYRKLHNEAGQYHPGIALLFKEA
ncbi:hypothetical protein HX870_32170 [Pseudomonas gingeri]|uniref:Uncharacterized protein n=1 Tax=Pseudomonas gingeri TaxID=117681 RepID=A0A7Y7XKZ7_9PSED|nr:hypothetical protein [Pseudomonas gingeri]NWA29158.1 hypothetical protein [Pseudomonas gingeri]NWC00769.1 hypothetical protein [Pseudomonas gingeri]NWD72270.1 hypothetical protein [Pseudomonas gingeri]NWD76537.1 hypothetical protein [Pseudomonas gingeri]